MQETNEKRQFAASRSNPLTFIIVGAGVAGLATAIGLRQQGHEVIILEQSNKLAEVGAGIQIPPNAARVLGHLGLFEKVHDKSTVLSVLSSRRWANNEELIGNQLKPVSDRYGWPLSFVYRGDLQMIFLDRAAELGIEIHVGQRVVQVDKDFGPRVQVSSGKWYGGDVILAADGIKSQIRAQMAAANGVVDRSIPTGDAAYRLVIPRENIVHDAEALKILDGDIAIRVIGPDGHIMMYPICVRVDERTGNRYNQLLNMAILHGKTSETPEDESWTSVGSKTEMLKFCEGWAPVVQTLISMVPEGEVLEWTLNTHKPLPTWIAGSVALMGDACHPMLPYLAQGAAQCLEDAAAMSECFAQTSDIPLALSVYELLRKARAEKIQMSGAEVRSVIHLPDGPEQIARDEKYRASSSGGRPDKLVDASFQDFMYGVDVAKEAQERWLELVQKVRGEI